MQDPATTARAGESPGPASAPGDTGALVALGQALLACGYHFVTPTPATHARVVARPEKRVAQTLRDVFGWSRPFRPDLLPESLLALMRHADVLRQSGPLLASSVRFSSLAGRLWVHSAFPTQAADAVFFGPDTARFAAFLAQRLPRPGAPAVDTLVDIGCGTGAGGILATDSVGMPRRLVLGDINATALAYARANAALAGIPAAECLASDVLGGVEGAVDLVVANPPFVMDPAHRAYRDGGADFGSALSLRMLRESLPRLAPGGRLLMYTGVAIVAGEDHFRSAAVPLLDAAGVNWTYEERDPDVFGEELELPAYAAVERIAVVGLVVNR